MTKLFLLIFSIILYICPLYTTAQTPQTIRIYSHTEGNNSPRVVATRIYQNGTVVARIVRNDPTTPNCFDSTLSLRIIHSNDGSVDEKDIKLNIPQFNYCGTSATAFLDYQLIGANQVLVTFYMASNPNDVNTYEQWGLIVDYNGKELSRISFGTQNQVIPNSKIVLNTNREKGFLRLASIRSNNAVITEWKQYKIELDGTFTQLTTTTDGTNGGTLSFDFFSTISTVVSTVGEGYSVLNAFVSNNNAGNAGTTNQNPLLQQGSVYAFNIAYNQSTVTSTILYQSSTPNLAFTDLSCDIALYGVGQICTLTVVVPGTAGTATYYVEIGYLSAGSVSSIKVASRVFSQNFANLIWKVNNLPFGGYLLTNLTTGTTNGLYGFLFNEGDTNPTPWAFNEPEPINSDGVFQILSNNTLLIFKETGNSWEFHAIDLPRFVANKVDNGYSNINVASTSPAINESIDSSKNTTVSINFYNPVITSTGNLSIYQVIDNQPYLRQTISGIECMVSPDGKTVSAEVLLSTFGVSSGNYFITVDNSFVKDGAYSENLLGIESNIWKFTTQERKFPSTPANSGLFRLNTDGTAKFDSLSKDERHDFFNTLRSELSLAVPVNPSRLTSIEKVQVDRSLNNKQYLISIRIEEAKDEHDISAGSVVDYINAMVRSKDQTPIGSGSVTNYLDETYGFSRLLSMWDRYKRQFIGLFFFIIFMLLAYVTAIIRTPERDDPTKDHKMIQNAVILRFGLILFDLVMDILFVSISAKDFNILYILSVIFVTVPMAVNASLAFYIITRENSKNQEFYNWFINNAKIASIFTVFSGANIEALLILKSHLLNIKLFQAPFSDIAEAIIYWGSIINIFLEDIPQVIIQIVYLNFAVFYGLIPLLTFVSSLLTLALKILAPFAYKLYKHHKDKKRKDHKN